MKVFFDNNVPLPLRYRLQGHEVTLTQDMGWQELKNGVLLAAAENAGFDVFLTGDKNIRYQQNLAGRRIALVVLGNPSWRVLRRDTSPVLEAVNRAMPGSFEELPTPPPE